MGNDGTDRLGGVAFGLVAAGSFILTLTLPSVFSWLFSSEPTHMGLPQFAAALVVCAAVTGGMIWRERTLAAAQGVAQARQQQLAQELKHQTGLAQGILGGLPMPFLLVDENERAVATNKDCLNMLEIDGRPEDYLGQTLAQIFYNDPGRKTAVGRSIGGGEVFRNLEVEIKGHKGGVRHVLANVFPLYDSDRRCLGGLCLYLDMTELKRKEQLIVNKNEGITRIAELANAVCARLRESSARLSGGIAQTGRGTDAQKQRLEGIGLSMDQMSAAVVDVAQSATAASLGADKSRAQAEQGARVVGEVIAAIRGVEERTEAMRERLTELDGQVSGIGQILNVITDIADQTNLLALNAAIEAARAGDAGRGFAVVADEVRKLAEKTMTATREVGEAIGSVQQGARRVVEVMGGASEAVAQSTTLADGAGQTLQEILQISQGSADQVRSIAAASEEQSASAEEISRAVSHVRQVSDQTAQDMVEAQETVNELARLADELTDIITKMQTC